MLPATPATSPLSDSSDSNADGCDPNGGGAYNEPPFVNIAECTSKHEGRQQFSTILPVNIDTLFRTLYARSKFLDEFHASRKIFDIEHTDWRLDEETNKRRRTYKSKMPIKATIGPKFSCITEIQTLRECSIPGSLYSIDITSWNENVPYGDVFTIYVHHCLVRTVDDHTMLSVYLYVKFRKSIFSVIRNLIEKTTYAGVEDYHNELALQLSRHFCSPPVRHKRHIRNAPRIKPDPLGDGIDNNSTAQTVDTGIHTLKSQKSAGGLVSHHHSANDSMAPQQSLANSQKAAINSPPKTRSTAFALLSLMIMISLLNVGLFLRLHLATTTTASRHHYAGDLLFMSDIHAQDVGNLSSDQWIRIFYSYHVQHQSKIAEMRHMLINSIAMLKQMEDNMLAVIASIIIPIAQKSTDGVAVPAADNKSVLGSSVDSFSLDDDLIR